MEARLCMLLHAPGRAGGASWPVGGIESLRCQMYVLARDAPGLDAELGRRSFDSPIPELDAAL